MMMIGTTRNNDEKGTTSSIKSDTTITTETLPITVAKTIGDKIGVELQNGVVLTLKDHTRWVIL